MNIWPAVSVTLHRLGAWHTLDRSIVVALAVSAVVAWAVVMVAPNGETDPEFDTWSTEGTTRADREAAAWSNINPLDERN